MFVIELAGAANKMARMKPLTDLFIVPSLVLRIVLALVLSPWVILAGDTATVEGRVDGAEGGILAGAKVNLINQDTNGKRETVTSEDGRFEFAEVPPGEYLLEVKASGFETFQTRIHLGTDKLAPLTIKLKLQPVKEELTVRPDTSEDRLSPESNTESMKIDETFFNGLPTEVDYLQPFIDTFVSPAAQGGEGTSVVVDGMDGGELDMPSSAIRTLKINRNPYSAEFQHPGSARAEITTKHGHRRRYEGNIAYFARNSIFDARNALAASNPDLNRRFIEGSVGGPLPGPTGSFFLAAQRLSNDQSAVVNSLDTVALTGPLNANVPAPERRDHSFLRTQWALNAMQSLSLNYTFSDHSSESNGVGALVLPDQGFSLGQHAHRLQVIHSIALAPELRNEIVFVFKVQKDRTGGPASGPEILVNGAFTGGASQSFEGKERHAFDLQDTATYLRGQHNFLFGATIRNDWWNVFDKTNFGGTFEFSSLAQYENVVQNHIGTPDFFQINRGNPQVSFFTQQTSGFAQDTMRLRPDFSLTLGLRYDWQNTLHDHNNLAPRLAMAFAPGTQNKTVLRAGAGVFYDNLPRTLTEDALLMNGVRVQEIDISSPSYPEPFQGGQVVSPQPSISRISPFARSPYLLQLSTGVEQEVWGGAWLSLEYSHLHGVHVFLLRDVNAPLPAGSDIRPNPNFLNIEEVESAGFLRGNALTFTFRGSLGKRFKGYGQYVLSKYINDVSTNGPGVILFPANNYDLRSETGPADFDRLHRLNFAGVFQLPRGFRAGTIFSAASGAPYNITTGSDPNGDTITRPPGVTRNTGRGPGIVQLDLRLTKLISLERASAGEIHHLRRSLEWSVDAFNALNHTNVMEIVGVVSSPLFGQPDSASPARTFQLSMKYNF
ncbi:MAG: hypothetical protein DMG40_22390 [Acidobacteria bacterium]|nr:MAG: hypothetical protein DMG40_22390 [Acidobacteriota bacterium]